MVITKAITAENQWSGPFELRGDPHNRGLRARALLQIVQGSVASTVSLRAVFGAGAITITVEQQ